MENKPNIFELKQKLNALLREHLELKPMQLELDEMLKGAGSQHNRCAIVTDMMLVKFRELNKHLQELLKFEI